MNKVTDDQTKQPFPVSPEAKQLDPNTMPERSRIKHRLENNSKKTLWISFAAIIGILIVLGVFGIPALVEFAKLTSNKEEAQTTEEELVVVLPPYFTTNFNATNSADIRIEGNADEGDTVKLYKDGKLVDDTKVTNDNTFSFKNVELKEGANSFKAKTFKESKESRFSEALNINYRKEAPKLEVIYPSDGQAISNKDGNRLQIEGTTEKDVRVTVNGSQAIVTDAGKFKYVISISGGENTVKVVATDDAGNKTEMERKFTYNP